MKNNQVHVYWEQEQEWFSGEIVEYNPEFGYKILYDDGDVTYELEDSSNIKFQVDFDKTCVPTASCVMENHLESSCEEEEEIIYATPRRTLGVVGVESSKVDAQNDTVHETARDEMDVSDKNVPSDENVPSAEIIASAEKDASDEMLASDEIVENAEMDASAEIVPSAENVENAENVASDEMDASDENVENVGGAENSTSDKMDASAKIIANDEMNASGENVEDTEMNKSDENNTSDEMDQNADEEDSVDEVDGDGQNADEVADSAKCMNGEEIMDVDKSSKRDGSAEKENDLKKDKNEEKDQVDNVDQPVEKVLYEQQVHEDDSKERNMEGEEKLEDSLDDFLNNDDHLLDSDDELFDGDAKSVDQEDEASADNGDLSNANVDEKPENGDELNDNVGSSESVEPRELQHNIKDSAVQDNNAPRDRKGSIELLNMQVQSVDVGAAQTAMQPPSDSEMSFDMSAEEESDEENQIPQDKDDGAKQAILAAILDTADEEPRATDVLTGDRLLAQINACKEKLGQPLMYAEPIEERKPPGPGFGTVMCNVMAATDVKNQHRQGDCDTFVKVSYVQPGKQTIMLRGKSTIHTTKVMYEQSNPNWGNKESFELQVAPSYIQTQNGQCANWHEIPGDLLFSLYDANGGERNDYIGQVAYALSDLVDQTVYEGRHPLHSKWFPMYDRNEQILPGKLFLELQLSLPEYVEQISVSRPKSPPRYAARTMHKTKVKEEDSNLSKTQNRHQGDNNIYAHRYTKPSPKPSFMSTKSSKEAHRISRERTKARIKDIEKEKRLAENRLQASRIRAVAPKKEAAPLSDYAVEKRNRKMQAKEARLKRSAAEQKLRKFEKQSELVAHVNQLHEQLGKIQQQVGLLQAKDSRNDIATKKLLFKVDKLKQKCAIPSGNSSHNTIFSSTSNQQSEYGSVSSLMREKLDLLESENSTQAQHKRQLGQELAILSREEENIEKKMEHLQEKISSIRKLAAPDLQNDKTASEIRALKAKINVLKNPIAALSNNNEKDHEERDKCIALQNRYHKKSEKLNACLAETEKFKLLYKSYMQDNVADKLRQSIVQAKFEALSSNPQAF